MTALKGLKRQAGLIALFGLLYGAAILIFDNAYHRLIITIVPIWAVMGLSWNVLSGYSGFISFGHAAFFGLGAYFVALGVQDWGLTPWIGIPLAGLIGAVAGLLIGLPTFRLRGHYFALAMLAYPLAFLSIFDWLGYQELALPMRRDAPLAFMQFEDDRLLAGLTLLLMLAAMAVTVVVERSRFGLSLLAIKQDEAAAEAAGIDTLAWKLKAIAVSGAMAGAAGGLYAIVLLVVTPPAVFGMLVSAQALTVAMFGGVATVWGPVIGAVILVPLSELLHAELGDIIPGIQGVVYGIAIIAVILLAPNGLFWRLSDLTRRRRPAATGASPPPAAPAAAVAERHYQGGPPVIEVAGLAKSFGGVRAVEHVSLTVREGEILGIIGPNGAGKTTFFNLLNGFQKPDAGRVRIFGADVTGRKPSRLCRDAVGRTFQVVKPFARMTVLENVTVGAFVHAKSDAEVQQAAERALAAAGLAGEAGRLAASLSTRELRLMELARALAGGPRILLMDEPLAGLGTAETEELIGIVRRLAEKGMTVVIIEHTMQAMVRLADRFLVLDHGAVLAEGAPQEVMKDPKVVEAYLGRKWMDHAAD